MLHTFVTLTAKTKTAPQSATGVYTFESPLSETATIAKIRECVTQNLKDNGWLNKLARDLTTYDMFDYVANHPKGLDDTLATYGIRLTASNSDVYFVKQDQVQIFAEQEAA